MAPSFAVSIAITYITCDELTMKSNYVSPYLLWRWEQRHQKAECGKHRKNYVAHQLRTKRSNTTYNDGRNT